MATETLPPGCYHHEQKTWVTLAASSYDEDGNEVVTAEDVALIGQRRDDEEWRFTNLLLAEAWAELIEAEPPIPIADLPHRCNGWAVRTQEPVNEQEGAGR